MLTDGVWTWPTGVVLNTHFIKISKLKLGGLRLRRATGLLFVNLWTGQL